MGRCQRMGLVCDTIPDHPDDLYCHKRKYLLTVQPPNSTPWLLDKPKEEKDKKAEADKKQGQAAEQQIRQKNGNQKATK